MTSIEQYYSRPSNYFSACHFLVGYLKCNRLHGHDYSVECQLKYQSNITDQTLDFRTVNLWIKQIITELDHKILLPGNSSEIKFQSAREGRNWNIHINEKIYSFPQNDVKILEGVNQTTCESIAKYLHQKMKEKLKESSILQVITNITINLSESVGNKVSYSSNTE